MIIYSKTVQNQHFAELKVLWKVLGFLKPYVMVHPAYFFSIPTRSSTTTTLIQVAHQQVTFISASHTVPGLPLFLFSSLEYHHATIFLLDKFASFFLTVYRSHVHFLECAFSIIYSNLDVSRINYLVVLSFLVSPIRHLSIHHIYVHIYLFFFKASTFKMKC